MQSTEDPYRYLPALSVAASKFAGSMANKIDFESYRELLFNLLFLKAVNIQLPPGLVLPPESQWHMLINNIDNPGIVEIADTSIQELLSRNISLKNLLAMESRSRQYSAIIMKTIINFIDSIRFELTGDIDLFTRLYEFIQPHGGAKNHGYFFTPDCIAKLLVELLQPQGKIYDPCCGTGTILFHAIQHIKKKGDVKKVSVYGEEGNDFLHRLCRMNFFLQGVDHSKISWHVNGSLLHESHPDLKADFILANPPFNVGGWGRENLMQDPRWIFGIPPANNSNYAWIQHIISHLKENGRAAIILPKGSLVSRNRSEKSIRKELVEAGVIEGIIELPDKLFNHTYIPVCIWLLTGS